MQNIDAILVSLRKAGFRITAARRAILETLRQSKEPYGALDIHALITRGGRHIDKVTVYRELRFLADQGIATALVFNDGPKRYQLQSEHGHKHHLICTECKSIQDVQVGHNDLRTLEKEISKRKLFSIKSHALEFYGLCTDCQS